MEGFRCHPITSDASWSHYHHMGMIEAWMQWKNGNFLLAFINQNSIFVAIHDFMKINTTTHKLIGNVVSIQMNENKQQKSK